MADLPEIPPHLAGFISSKLPAAIRTMPLPFPFVDLPADGKQHATSVRIHQSSRIRNLIFPRDTASLVWLHDILINGRTSGILQGDTLEPISGAFFRAGDPSTFNWELGALHAGYSLTLLLSNIGRKNIKSFQALMMLLTAVN